MANNRMYIKCDKCGDKKTIAKYYPSSGWYFECIQEGGRPIIDAESKEELEAQISVGGLIDEETEDTQKINAFNDWRDKHRHNDFSSEGPTHFSIEFE